MFAEMGRQSSTLVKAALSTLKWTGAAGALAPLTGGIGAIFCLQHVAPEPPRAFAPNRHRTITPAFLDATIRTVLAQGFDILSMDGVHRRIAEGNFDRPFAAFTFDGGTRDILQHAYPTFLHHNVPFAIYVASDFADGTGDYWWVKLEKAIAALDAVELKMYGTWSRIVCGTTAQKYRAFETVETWLRTLPEADVRAIVSDLCRLNGVGVDGLCAELAMNWTELRALARDPLVTIAAQSRGHWALARLEPASARQEMASGRTRLATEIGRPCHHFSYPYGDETSAGTREFEMAQELGFATGVTTRAGLLHAGDVDGLMALPRLALDGRLQKTRYVSVMLSGAPFALRDRAERRSRRAAA